MKLTRLQKERYNRQLILSDVGDKGQKKLLSSKVLIIGCGGLGSSCAYYLTSSGVGNIGLVDPGNVELNNLQRQILYSTNDIGKPKVISAKKKLNKLNPDVKIDIYQLKVTVENVLKILKGYDIIVDCSDNLETRFIVNDACVFLSKPLVHAAVLRFSGQAMTIIPHKGPCYRCIFSTLLLENEEFSCHTVGILSTVAGLFGIIQATEVIKLILDIGEPLVGKMLVFSAIDMSFKEIKVKKNPCCPVCGK